VMLEGGADIRYVQQMLGHASITSTQIYTRVSMRELQAVHAATHPGASSNARRRGEGARSPNAARPDRAGQSAAQAASALHEELGAEAAEERGELG
jgi:integrase/recombinase XerD